MMNFFLVLSLECPALEDNRSDKTRQCKVSLKTFHRYPPMCGDIEIEMLYS